MTTAGKQRRRSLFWSFDRQNPSWDGWDMARWRSARSQTHTERLVFARGIRVYGDWGSMSDFCVLQCACRLVRDPREARAERRRVVRGTCRSPTWSCSSSFNLCIVRTIFKFLVVAWRRLQTFHVFACSLTRQVDSTTKASCRCMAGHPAESQVWAAPRFVLHMVLTRTTQDRGQRTEDRGRRSQCACSWASYSLYQWSAVWTDHKPIRLCNSYIVNKLPVCLFACNHRPRAAPVLYKTTLGASRSWEAERGAKAVSGRRLQPTGVFC